MTCPPGTRIIPDVYCPICKKLTTFCYDPSKGEATCSECGTVFPPSAPFLAPKIYGPPVAEPFETYPFWVKGALIVKPSKFRKFLLGYPRPYKMEIVKTYKNSYYTFVWRIIYEVLGYPRDLPRKAEELEKRIEELENLIEKLKREKPKEYVKFQSAIKNIIRNLRAELDKLTGDLQRVSEKVRLGLEEYRRKHLPPPSITVFLTPEEKEKYYDTIIVEFSRSFPKTIFDDYMLIAREIARLRKYAPPKGTVSLERFIGLAEKKAPPETIQLLRMFLKTDPKLLTHILLLIATSPLLTVEMIASILNVKYDRVTKIIKKLREAGYVVRAGTIANKFAYAPTEKLIKALEPILEKYHLPKGVTYPTIFPK